MIAINDEFMKFDSLEDMARHHIDLLSRKRYQAFSGGVDEFAARVKNGGYATSSNYIDALNKMRDSVKKVQI
jgi:flagellum-specific peptidoglycan hydrolase FlgJ